MDSNGRFHNIQLKIPLPNTYLRVVAYKVPSDCLSKDLEMKRVL
jgi:hypothetical protein